jgi:hypothetical protein
VAGAGLRPAQGDRHRLARLPRAGGAHRRAARAVAGRRARAGRLRRGPGARRERGAAGSRQRGGDAPARCAAAGRARLGATGGDSRRALRGRGVALALRGGWPDAGGAGPQRARHLARAAARQIRDLPLTTKPLTTKPLTTEPLTLPSPRRGEGEEA